MAILSNYVFVVIQATLVRQIIFQNPLDGKKKLCITLNPFFLEYEAKGKTVLDIKTTVKGTYIDILSYLPQNIKQRFVAWTTPSFYFL